MSEFKIGDLIVGDLIVGDTGIIYTITNDDSICEVIDLIVMEHGNIAVAGTDLQEVEGGTSGEGDIVVRLLAHKRRDERIGSLYRVESSQFILFNPNEHRGFNMGEKQC